MIGIVLGNSCNKFIDVWFKIGTQTFAKKWLYEINWIAKK